MTFEDYKRHFEAFSKIDTPEKLTICENQYKKHLLHIEDEEYFEPLKQRLGDNILNQYKKTLDDIFLFNKIKDKQFYFLVIPSFEPENLLILDQRKDDYSLTHVALSKNYWSVLSADNKITDIEKAISKTELNKAIGDNLFALLDKTVFEARQPKANGFTLDGVIYRLSKLSNGEQKIVSKHSPSETSKSGRIIKIMQQLIDNIETLNDANLSNIRTQIENLQD